MPTLTWGGAGGQTVTYARPQELSTFGNPQPPRQPIASWAVELTQFQSLCSGADFAGAVAWAQSQWVLVSNADVPGGALAGLQTYLRDKFPLQNTAPNTGLPPCFNTAAGQTWRAT